MAVAVVLNVPNNQAQRDRDAKAHKQLCQDVIANDMPAAASDAGKRGYAECVQLLLPRPRQSLIPDAFMLAFFLAAFIAVAIWMFVHPITRYAILKRQLRNPNLYAPDEEEKKI
jgi:hypothetical protein